MEPNHTTVTPDGSLRLLIVANDYLAQYYDYHARILRNDSFAEQFAHFLAPSVNFGQGRPFHSLKAEAIDRGDFIGRSVFRPFQLSINIHHQGPILTDDENIIFTVAEAFDNRLCLNVP